MENLFEYFAKFQGRSRKERRRHPRESCFIQAGYVVQGHSCRGSIRNISPGGAYVDSYKNRKFSPGEEVLLVAKIGVLRDQIRGRIVWVGLYGMGVEFQTSEVRYGESEGVPKDICTPGRESKKMGKIKGRKVRWEPSSTADVIKYRLYWSIGGGVDYHSDHADVGNVSEIMLPNDIPSFPLTSGKFELGISAINQAGNESELTKATVHVNFTIPEAPGNLIVEDM
jgi:hypothetical protein